MAIETKLTWLGDLGVEVENLVQRASTGDGHQQRTLSSNIASRKAAIEDDAAKVESKSANIASLAIQIASLDSDLAAASAVRTKETQDFSNSEADFMDAIDTFQRAISILQKEMAKNPAHGRESSTADRQHGTLAFHFGEKARLAFKPVHVLPGLDHCDFCPRFFVTAVSYGEQDETPAIDHSDFCQGFFVTAVSYGGQVETPQ